METKTKETKEVRCVDCNVSKTDNPHFFTFKKNQVLADIRDIKSKQSEAEFEDVCCYCTFNRAKIYNDFLLEEIFKLQNILKGFSN